MGTCVIPALRRLFQEDQNSFTPAFLFKKIYYHLKKCLQYISVKFTPSIILLYPPSSILRMLSTGLIFPFAYMSTQYFHHVRPPTPFLYILPPPTGTNPETGLFYLPVLCFWKKTFLFGYLHRDFHYDISIYIFIVSWILDQHSLSQCPYPFPSPSLG
jgi:hypothetical protein